MSRGLSAGVQAVIGNANLHFFHLYTFHFATPFRVTDHSHDLSYNFGSGTETFTSSARIVSTGDSEESLDISNPTMSIVFTGANEADLLLPFTENYNNKRVVIYRGYFDDSGNTTSTNIIADPFIYFDGRVDSYSISDNPNNSSSTVTWKVASHWADWDKINGRRCNPDSAKVHFPNEECFSHMYDQIGQKTWGRVVT
jgi:hypothetical protein